MTGVGEFTVLCAYEEVRWYAERHRSNELICLTNSTGLSRDSAPGLRVFALSPVVPLSCCQPPHPLRALLGCLVI